MVDLGPPGTLMPLGRKEHQSGHPLDLEVVAEDKLVFAPAKPIKIPATWLILPVVTRSSQRLSHACASLHTKL